MLPGRPPARPRTTDADTVLTGARTALAECGWKSDSASSSDPQRVKQGAELFAARCGGCHTFSKAGTQGGAFKVKDRERVDGPNFDARKETVSQVLYAIRNGGLPGPIMPQNIATGKDPPAIPQCLAKNT